jgi:succinoglycan biosynthesis protein ExoV
MKLFYYKDLIGNFGDDMNAWLWPKVFGEIFDENTDYTFVGIGTILNQNLPIDTNRLIFGSGYGYGDVPVIEKHDKIFFVRGEYTARILGINKSLAITDPAILVKIYFDKQKTNKYPVSLIPHHTSDENADWQKICNDINVNYISPAWDVEKVLDDINNSSLVVTESMHGAIIADAFRVPWMAYHAYGHINRDKWQDWANTHSVEYKPIELQEVWDVERHLNIKQKFKNKIKRGLLKNNIWNQAWMMPPPAKSGNKEYDSLCKQLETMVASQGNLMLSEDVTHERLLNQVNAKVEEFRKFVDGI